MPTIAFDYFFFSKNENNEGTGAPMIAMHDDRMEMMKARRPDGMQKCSKGLGGGTRGGVTRRWKLRASIHPARPFP